MSQLIKILQAMPVDGKSHLGRTLAKTLGDILENDRCTSILIDKVGVDAFARELATLIPETTVGYCNDYQYEVEWRHSIWQAAWEAWQEVKNKVKETK